MPDTVFIRLAGVRVPTLVGHFYLAAESPTKVGTLTPQKSDTTGSDGLFVNTVMNHELPIGFIGFGEAGYHLAKGLRGAGVAHLRAFANKIGRASCRERV